jgi:hypothetical protein
MMVFVKLNYFDSEEEFFVNLNCIEYFGMDNEIPIIILSNFGFKHIMQTPKEMEKIIISNGGLIMNRDN